MATGILGTRSSDSSPCVSCNNLAAQLRHDEKLSNGDIAMAARKKKEYDLGSNGTITFHVSEDARRLLIDFDVEEKGLTKTAINLLIDALKETRKTMVR